MEKLLGEEWTKRIQTILTLTFPIVVGVGGFLGTKVLSNELRLTAIEANRYTQKDAASDREWVTEEFVEIRKEQTALLRELNEKHSELLKVLSEK